MPTNNLGPEQIRVRNRFAVETHHHELDVSDKRCRACVNRMADWYGPEIAAIWHESAALDPARTATDVVVLIDCVWEEMAELRSRIAGQGVNSRRIEQALTAFTAALLRAIEGIPR